LNLGKNGLVVLIAERSEQKCLEGRNLSDDSSAMAASLSAMLNGSCESSSAIRVLNCFRAICDETTLPDTFSETTDCR
jgi:hypothetical protein